MYWDNITITFITITLTHTRVDLRGKVDITTPLTGCGGSNPQTKIFFL